MAIKMHQPHYTAGKSHCCQNFQFVALDVANDNLQSITKQIASATHYHCPHHRAYSIKHNKLFGITLTQSNGKRCYCAKSVDKTES